MLWAFGLLDHSPAAEYPAALSEAWSGGSGAPVVAAGDLSIVAALSGAAVAAAGPASHQSTNQRIDASPCSLRVWQCN